MHFYNLLIVFTLYIIYTPLNEMNLYFTVKRKEKLINLIEFFSLFLP